MASSAADQFFATLRARDIDADIRPVPQRPDLLRDLIEGRASLARSGDDTVVMIHADGLRETLSPEQTAALAAAILRFAAEGQADRELLLNLHSIAAARNLLASNPSGDATFSTGAPAMEEPPEEPQPEDDPFERAIAPDAGRFRESATSARAFEGSGTAESSPFRTGYDAGFVGPGRGHLSGLPDEDLRFRASFQRGLTVLDIADQGTPLATDIGEGVASEGAGGPISSSPFGSYEPGFVGPGLRHLAHLPNEDYRFAEIAPRPLKDPRFEAVNRESAAPVPVPLQVFDIRVAEDTPIAGTVFPEGVPAGATIRDLAVTLQPAIGLVSIDEDGNFVIDAPQHFSGSIVFSYAYTDGTGERRTGTAVALVTAVVDAPAVSSGVGAFMASEDETLALTGLSAALVDADGSESLTRITIEGAPPGARFIDAAGEALGRDLGGGTWLFAAQELGWSRIAVPAHVSGVFDLTLRVASTEGSTGETAESIATFSVAFAAVADRPSLSVGSGDFTGPEDAAIPLTGLAAMLVDVDGSESLVALGIVGVAAGAHFVDAAGQVVGRDEGAGVWTFSPAELADLRFIAPEHVAGSFEMTLIATARETANGDEATSALPFRVTTTPVVDAPLVSVGAGAFSGVEDTRIALAGFSADLVDRDGSETLTAIRITGVPEGTVFTDAAGVASGISEGGGVWRFSVAAVGSLHIQLPAHRHGAYDLVFEASSVETVTGEAAISRMPFKVTVDAAADAPAISPGSSRGDEDSAILFGTGVNYALVDADGSEAVTALALSGFPAGSQVFYTLSGAAAVTLAAGVYTIAGPPADIRATLDSFSVRPPSNSDANIAISVTVTTTDADGSSAMTSAIHAIIVDAVADAPAGSGDASGAEDADIPLSIAMAVADMDGSETITQVRIEDVPSGASLNWVARPGATVTNLGGGAYAIEGQESAIREVLATLTLRPPLHSDVDFSLRVTVRASETDPTGAGEVSLLHRETSFLLPVIVAATADLADVPATGSRGDEDSAILFGANIIYALVDNDGSEAVTAVAMSGFPIGATVSYAQAGTATVTATSGIYTITGSPADIRATLDSFAVIPPADSDANFALTVAVTTTDGDGSTATRQATHAIVTDAVADAPAGSGSAVGTEDSVPVDIVIANADSDGSQSITAVTLQALPAAMTLSWTNQTGATVTAGPAGLYEIAGTEAAIRAVLATIVATPPANAAGTFAIAVTVTSSETSPTEPGEIAVLSATTSFVVTVLANADADAPTLATVPVTGNEDAAIPFGAAITYALVDTDGSEVISSVALSGLPAGATLAYVVAAGASVALTGGVWTISGSESAIRTTLDSMAVQPPADRDADFAIAIAVTSTDGGVSSATTSGAIQVQVRAVADAPAVSASASGAEDQSIPIVLGLADADVDGSQSISAVRIDGVPAGGSLTWSAAPGVTAANLGGGVYEFTGTEAAIRATLASLALTPPINFHGTLTLQVTATSTETNPSEPGDVAVPSASTTIPLTVTIAAVADQPLLAAPGWSGEEDQRIALSGLDVSLADADGSESIVAIRITGVPAGARFSDASGAGRGVDNGDGSWSFVPAQLAGLHFVPALNVHGVVNLQLKATTSEGSNGATATAALAFAITVDAQADAPTVTAGSVTIGEDVLTNVGTGIAYALVDQDGSERVVQVEITGFPAGATVILPAFGAAAVATIAGGYRITGPSADIRATINGLAVQAPTNSDADIALTIAVTAVDADGSTATSSASYALNVAAVADQPTISGAAAGDEDAFIAVPVTVALMDLDGSETLFSVVVSQVPAGATLAWNTGLPGTVTPAGAGSFAFTGSTAEIQALLLSLSVRPPLHSDADLTLRFTATTRESNPAGGQVSVLDAVTIFDVPVTVAAVADQADVPATGSRGDEDTVILFGPNVVYALVDTDGSESVTSLTLSGFPAGSAVTYAASGAASVTLAAGVYSITGSSPDIRATLDSFSVRPPINSDANFSLAVAVTTTDTGGSIATRNATHAIVVDAVADAPTGSGSAAGDEDTDIPLTIAMAVADADGSESITLVRIENVPPGGSLNWLNQPGATVTNLGGGTYTIAGAESAIRDVLATLTIRPPLHSDADFSLTVTVRASETNLAEAGEVSLLHRETSFALPVSVAAVADQPTLPNASTNGLEDTTITFGPNVVYALVDADGSESVTSVAVFGVPAGWTLAYTATGGGSVTASAGVFTITGSPAGIRATLDTFRVTPPLDDDADAVLSISVTTTDTGGGTATRAATHTVVVAADADTPAISVGTGSFNGQEDQPIALAGFAAAITDTDAGAGRAVSETLQVVRITGVPAGASFQNGAAAPVGVSVGGGTWTFTAAELATLRFVPPTNVSSTFNMNLEAIARETSNGDLSATASLPFTVSIVDIPDTPLVTTGSTNGVEDTAIVFGPGITYATVDTDGSESITEVVVSGIAAGWTIGYTETAGGIVDASTPGSFRISGTEAGIRATLDTFRITPPLDSDEDTTVQVTVTARDASGGTATSAPATHAIVVAADADAPSVNVGAAAFATNEDIRVQLSGFGVAISDTDASAGRAVSEVLSLIRITGVSNEAGTSFQNTAGAAVGMNLGGGVWTFTQAQVADLWYVPGTNRSGSYAMNLEATARENSNLDTAVFSRAFTVNVAGVPDQVTVGSGTYNMNEDTQANNMGASFGVALSDNDGSQQLTLVLNGLPTGTGSVVTYTASGGVTHSLVAGVLTLSGASNLVLTTLTTLDLRAPTNSDANWTVTVTATTSENGTTLSDVVGSRVLRVRAIADTPTVSGSASGMEDAVIGVPINVSLPDNDGSESLNFVDVRLLAGTPAGTVLTVTAQAGATAVYNGGTATWRVTGSTAAVQATLLSGVTVQSAPHNGSNITVQVQARSIEGATALEVLTATATSVFTNVIVTVNDVADKPDVNVPANQLIEEDTPINLSAAGLGLVKVDADGSEVFTLTLAGVPDGSSFGGRGTPGAPVGGLRTWTFTEAEISGLTMTPPLHLHGSWTITATTTARETENNNTAVSDPKVFQLTVDAQADQPTVSTVGATGDEDASIVFGGTLAAGIALVDADGSERLLSVAISGFPGGVTPTWSLVGTGSVALAGGVYTITATTEADLRATLATFAMTPPLHSDANIPLSVTATTIDADGSTAARGPMVHTVIVRAIADQPNLSVGATAGGPEDSNIALSIAADRVDADGSEVLSLRITLPAGVSTGSIQGNTTGGGSIASQGGGIFLVTAPTEAQLDAILASLSFRPPANWSGTATLTIEAIATETGPEILTASASRTATIDVTVGSVADPPALKVVPSIGGASGFEDEPIRLSIAVTLPDGDGSETYVVRLSGQPAGSVYTNAMGAPLGTQVSPGVWEFTPAELAIAHIVAPLHSSDNFSIDVEAIVSDVGPTGTSVTSLTGVLPINVIGVADAPTVSSPVMIVSAEDQPIPLGANVIATLVDTDGSETLYYVIAGLPTGVVPSRGTYIGGEWQISAADMPFVTIPAPANFSGNYVASFAPGLAVRAVTQENDGDEAIANIAVGITITPVVDGFSWSPGVTLAEESAIVLSAAAFGGALSDNDGSETIVSYTFNLNGIVAAAQIGGVVANTAAFIANHVFGPFTNNGDGTITVAAASMGLVSFSAAAFRDSNVNFSIPVSARVQESNGAFQIVNSSFSVSLEGVADAPTVFANSVSGTAGTPIVLNPTGAEFGGLSTDTDTVLGRASSERIYYIVSGLQSNPAVELAFTNAAGQIVGLDNGDGTWYLEPDDLVGLRVITAAGGDGTVDLTLTTVAVENDSGSRAQSATPATFSVTVVPGSGGGGPAPLPPQVQVNVSSANEDGTIPINVTAQAAPGDTTNPTVSVMFSNVPLGFILTGATFNPATGRWIATADDVNAGLVTLRPPLNWAGSLTGAATLQIEAVAVNSFLNRATTGLVAAPITVTPVADGPSFGANPAAGIEDIAIALNLSVTPADAEASSPEFVVNPIIITVPAGTGLTAGTNVGGNVWHVTTAQLAGLALTPPANYHGPLSIGVNATTQDVNGDTRSGSTTINLTVAARADTPNATASNVAGTEDTPIALTGLSAALVDTDGSEVLSVKIAGVPEGAIFSAGGNNGDGTWTIPVSALATLSITPPAQFSGMMSLTLIAYALETSNGDTAARTLPFTVTVAPAADIVILDPLNMTIAEDGAAVMPLRVLLADLQGTLPGENPAEQVQINFSGLPAGASITGAGAIVDQGGGSWRFTGTEAQANALTFVAPADFSGAVTVSLSAVSIDGPSVLATPATDSFQIAVTAVADAPVLQTNTIRGTIGPALPVNLYAFPSDTDGSETLSVTVSGVPVGAMFSAGLDLGGGAWRFTQAQLAGLTLTLPGGATDATFTVAATATEAANGSTATTNGVIQLFVAATGFSAAGTDAADLMTGGFYNDTFLGGLGADTINGGGGIDRVDYGASATAITVNLMTNVNTGGLAEGDILTSVEEVIGSAYADLITGDGAANYIEGYGGADTIHGGAGNDTIRGGNGADLLYGGLGDDIFYVDHAGDVVVENAGEGVDEVRTILNHTLAANVENLTYTGGGAFVGTGNGLANIMTGGAGADTLSGMAGADVLIGGQGADTMTGGVGPDIFRYLAGDTAGGPDVVTDFTAGAGGDVIDLELLLPGYDGNPLTLSSYVNIAPSGGDTILRIDPGGTSAFATTVLTLQGVTGLDLDSLRVNGNIVA